MAYINNFYLNEEFSDFTFIVQGERIPVHRIVLASQSVYLTTVINFDFEQKF